MKLFDHVTLRIYGQHLTLSVSSWLQMLDDMRPDADNARRIREAIDEPAPMIDVDELERQRAAAGPRPNPSAAPAPAR